TKTHAKLWKRLSENETQLMGLIKDNSNAQADGKADIIMSATPLLTGTDPDYMVDIWYKVVRATAVYSTTNLDKPSTISINVHKNIFLNRTKLDTILKKLRDEATEVELGDIRLVTLKILDSNLESETDIVKANYRYFVMGLADYAKATKRLLLLMNTDTLGLISIALGVDGFVEPVDGRLGLFGFSSTIRKGARYNPDALRSYPYEQWVILNPVYASTTEEEWKIEKRLWLLKSRDEEIDECHKAILDKTIYLGMKDKVRRSAIKNYLDVFP
ncbi:MAG: hypothetical protein ACREBF_00670, partial [Candidatus Micrarchaeales archaeon]